MFQMLPYWAQACSFCLLGIETYQIQVSQWSLSTVSSAAAAKTVTSHRIVVPEKGNN